MSEEILQRQRRSDERTSQRTCRSVWPVLLVVIATKFKLDHILYKQALTPKSHRNTNGRTERWRGGGGERERERRGGERASERERETETDRQTN